MAQFFFTYKHKSGVSFNLRIQAEGYFVNEYSGTLLVERYAHRVELDKVEVLEVEMCGFVLDESCHRAFEEFLQDPQEQLALENALKDWNEFAVTVEH